MESYDLVVVGGGPGGYVAAIRAAQLGLRTLCVERENLGGVCLNWGCIPTKALLRSAEVLDLCRRADDFGITVSGEVSFDFAKIIGRSREVAASQEKGIKFLFKKYQVNHMVGTATLASRSTVTIESDGQSQTVAATSIILATGARARSIAGVNIDGKRIIEYRGALTLASLPKSMIVLGAGAIGVEFASFYRTLGVEVTIIEYQASLVPNEDPDVAKELGRSFKKAGIEALVNTRVTGATAGSDHVTVSIESANETGANKQTRSADIALVAIGVQGNTENLGLETNDVLSERGFISVQKPTYQSSVPNVYAIGDVIGPPALAHVASAEAIQCVERLAGHTPTPIDYDCIPACTFCQPEIGSVGMTEPEAKASGLAHRVGKFPFMALGKARAAGDTQGFVKVIYAADNGRVLGAHIVGHNASDLIAEFALAKTTEANAQSIIDTIHAHPTLAEANKEATEHAFGQAIHI